MHPIRYKWHSIQYNRDPIITLSLSLPSTGYKYLTIFRNWQHWFDEVWCPQFDAPRPLPLLDRSASRPSLAYHGWGLIRSPWKQFCTTTFLVRQHPIITTLHQGWEQQLVTPERCCISIITVNQLRVLYKMTHRLILTLGIDIEEAV